MTYPQLTIYFKVRYFNVQISLSMDSIFAELIVRIINTKQTLEENNQITPKYAIITVTYDKNNYCPN